MTLRRLPLAAILLALLSPQLARAQADAGLSIDLAAWGSGTKFVDVTAKLQGAIRNNRLSITASADALGDPTPGTPKVLRIAYTLNGRRTTVIFPEDAKISLGAVVGRAVTVAAAPSAHDAQTVEIVRRAPVGDDANGEVPKVRKMAEVQALMVSKGPDGDYHGAIVDIIATAPRDPKSTITVRGDIGKEMRVSLDEAIRLVEIRHENSVRASIELSFGDKYTSKDGGSAGTAFALLLLSSLGDFELNPAAAITGDITIDSKVRPVGEVPAKTHGAALDKAKIVAIPDQNSGDFDDAMLLSGPSVLWETQIFAIHSLDDAIAVMRKDPDEKTTEALALFDKLKSDYSAKPVGALAAGPGAASLAKILTLAPNHLSAKNLQLLAAGKGPKALSAIATVTEAMRAMGPMRPALIDDSPHPELTKNGTLITARKNLDKVRVVADKTALPVVKALDEFCVAYSAWAAVTSDPKALPADKKRVTTVIDQKIDAVDTAIHNVITDKAVIDKMMHE